jgi:sialidase-1
VKRWAFKEIIMRRLIVIVVLAASVGPSPAAVPGPEIVDVFVAPRDGYPNFRIPALVVTNQGTLLATAEGRQANSDHAENKLVCKRSTDGGRTWGRLQLLDDEGQVACNDTSMVVCRSTGRILGLYTLIPAEVDEYHVVAGFQGLVSRHFLIHSDDDGRTWSKPCEITRMIKRPEAQCSDTAPGMGLELRRPPHAGRLLVPLWQKYRGATWAMMALSDDGGRTWRLGGDVPGYGPKEPKRGINESQVVELADGRIRLTGRGWDGERLRKTSFSADGGQTWSRLVDDPLLVDPHCMASLVRYSDPLDGRRSRILFANAAHAKNRANGTVRLSYDEGLTWPVAKVLTPGGYGYSCLVRLTDGSVGCYFENNIGGRWHLSFARFSLAWLTDGSDDGTR